VPEKGHSAETETAEIGHARVGYAKAARQTRQLGIYSALQFQQHIPFVTFLFPGALPRAIVFRSYRAVKGEKIY
jgi:hypothetical protein